MPRAGAPAPVWRQNPAGAAQPATAPPTPMSAVLPTRSPDDPPDNVDAPARTDGAARSIVPIAMPG